MKCTLSINRPTVNGDSESVIELVLRIERGKTITVPVSPADFALALTGKSDVPAELRLRGVSVMPAGRRELLRTDTGPSRQVNLSWY